MQSFLITLSSGATQALQAFWLPPWLILSLTFFLSLVLRDFQSTTKGVKAPIVGRWPLEPYLLTGLRFKRWSMVHLADGYSKVGPHFYWWKTWKVWYCTKETCLTVQDSDVQSHSS